VPVTVTAVAFVAATVNMDELPDVIEAGLAAMFTVGIAVDVLLKLAPPHPVKTRRSGNMNTIAKGEEILLINRWAHVFITLFPSDFVERANARLLDSQVAKSARHKAGKISSRLRSLRERFVQYGQRVQPCCAGSILSSAGGRVSRRRGDAGLVSL
jgi:hypothetical protein